MAVDGKIQTQKAVQKLRNMILMIGEKKKEHSDSRDERTRQITEQDGSDVVVLLIK